ncbi:TetR family transcriptional regulator [Spongiactinospora gelatinilytica]|uniref:TetR family transcriptional regulator n=1 Tax=Spongiactinospora gelatinilytica TaxID=2666298 RepID=A0A2W2GVI9_9ACTN|nr:TetR family transcriptional regulator [Spongiactinospora gelatinilytica]
MYSVFVGHREDLLEGAKRCLYERGYAHTTTRDIVAASGTNLASIGYHFGSKEALLTQALIEILSDWSDNIEGIELPEQTAGDPIDQFQEIWERVTGVFAVGAMEWNGSFEAFVQMKRSPEVLASIARKYEEGRLGLPKVFEGVVDADGERANRAFGGLLLSLLIGQAVQREVDPEHAPTARDLAEAIRLFATAAANAKRDD